MKKLSTWAAVTSGITALVTGCTTPKNHTADSPPVERSVLASVLDHDGKQVSKDALLGHWSVLWFYPKARTPG